MTEDWDVGCRAVERVQKRRVSNTKCIYCSAGANGAVNVVIVIYL